MTTLIPQEASLASVLNSMRGTIVDARLGHPEVLHVEIRDPDGDIWCLVTQDADWSPRDPTDLTGRKIEDVEVGDHGDLRCVLSGDLVFAVTPSLSESQDDPPYWELITPGGVALEFGPGVRWQISSADAQPR